jgi:hypothetical protein
MGVGGGAHLGVVAKVRGVASKEPKIWSNLSAVVGHQYAYGGSSKGSSDVIGEGAT